MGQDATGVLRHENEKLELLRRETELFGTANDSEAFAVDDVESTTEYRVVPMCWYVGEWFDQNPERAALLTR